MGVKISIKIWMDSGIQIIQIRIQIGRKIWIKTDIKIGPVIRVQTSVKLTFNTS